MLDINLSSFENINQNGGCGKFMVYGFLDSLNVIVFYGKVDDSLETGNDFYKFNNNLLEGIQFHKYDKIENLLKIIVVMYIILIQNIILQ
ncbi:MAG: hypothetical protein IPN93_07890 [Bacteroidetes bacterium]|nr:hypothetical protein [Bacteroidota bacterium]